jgi:hypothetical protein
VGTVGRAEQEEVGDGLRRCEAVWAERGGG